MKHAGSMYVFSILLLSIAFDGTFGGGIGGGAPPAEETNQYDFMMLKDAARNADIIRNTVSGLEPNYLQPDISSIKRHSLSAVNIASGDSTIFYAYTEAERLQHAFSQNLARTIASVVPGALPIAEEDFSLKLGPKIEPVPAKLFDKLSSPDTGVTN